MLSLNACASTPKPIIDNPLRPEINDYYAGLLRGADKALQKEAAKHEWDWLFYADKMENRTK